MPALVEISSQSKASNDVEPLVLKARTPRIDKIFSSDSNLELKIVLEEIAQDYFSNELATVLATPTGSYDAGASLPMLEKLEFFLDIIEHQRKLHLRRKPETLVDAIFSESDMKVIYKEWMHEGSWMNEETATTYNSLLNSPEKECVIKTDVK